MPSTAARSSCSFVTGSTYSLRTRSSTSSSSDRATAAAFDCAAATGGVRSAELSRSSIRPAPSTTPAAAMTSVWTPWTKAFPDG